jgi:hypothetical protein
VCQSGIVRARNRANSGASVARHTERWLGLFEQVRAIYKWSGCRLIMPLREAVG